MLYLPDELWLQIVAALRPDDLWILHQTSRQLQRVVEEVWQSPRGPISIFLVGPQFSLGSGSHHRWFDVRVTITFTFQSFSSGNPQYAKFGSSLVVPEGYCKPALEKWKRMCRRGIGDRQDWRVQCGYEGDLRVLKLPHLQLVGDEGVGLWVDWREMFNIYFRPDLESRRKLERDLDARKAVNVHCECDSLEPSRESI